MESSANATTRFAERLQVARKAQLLTRQLLAERTGLSVNRLAKYERDKNANPTAAVLLRLSECLDVSVDWLLGNDSYCSEKGVPELAPFVKETVKRDCFGFNNGSCRALRRMLCKENVECPFYKPKIKEAEEWQKD